MSAPLAPPLAVPEVRRELVAQLKDLAILNDDAGLALALLYVENDGGTNPTITAISQAAALREVARLLTRSLSTALAAPPGALPLDKLASALVDVANVMQLAAISLRAAAEVSQP